MSQLEWIEHVDFAFYLYSHSPLRLVRVLQLKIVGGIFVVVVSSPPKMKEICRNGNLENCTYTCEIRQILVKFLSQPLCTIYNNALFCVRDFFFWLCKEHVCRTVQA
jgi:hypothetical protein